MAQLEFQRLQAWPAAFLGVLPTHMHLVEHLRKDGDSKTPKQSCSGTWHKFAGISRWDLVQKLTYIICLYVLISYTLYCMCIYIYIHIIYIYVYVFCLCVFLSGKLFVGACLGDSKKRTVAALCRYGPRPIGPPFHSHSSSSQRLSSERPEAFEAPLVERGERQKGGPKARGDKCRFSRSRRVRCEIG